MNETEYQAVISTYQQKAFELFNQNIVYETQISTLKAQVDALKKELEKYTNTNKRSEELY